MKRILTILSALALLLGISSCSRETAGTDINSTTTNRITFSISIPKGDPVTYQIHDSQEWNIKSLYLLAFDQNKKLIKTPISSDDLVAGGHLTGNGPTYTYTAEVKPEDLGSFYYVFVANYPTLPGAIVAGASYDAVTTALAEKVLANTEASGKILNNISTEECIPMTGLATQGGNPVITINAATPDITVTMDRIVARLDISNKVPNLQITDITLSKTSSSSYLCGDWSAVFGSTTARTDLNSAKVDGITLFTALSANPFTSSSTINGEAGELKKAFYMYERAAAATKAVATSVEITGTLAGIPVHYSIPFWDKSADKGIEIKRNYLYKLVLGDGTTPISPNSDIDFTFTVLEWNLVNLVDTWQPINTAETNGFSGTGVLKRNGMTPELTLDKTAHASEIFTLQCNLEGHTTFGAVVAPVKVGDATNWLTATVSGDKVTINVQANDAATAADREAYVVVTSNVSADIKYMILVKQAK